MPEHKIPILHIMKSPPLFPWIPWWMLCSHPSRRSNLPEGLITLSLANCYAPSGSFLSMKQIQCEHLITCAMLCTEFVPFHSVFKNRVKNATIWLRSQDERDWPSFLYPPGTEYDVSELEKDLFQGPIVIRVCFFLSHTIKHVVKLFTDLVNDLYKQKLCIHWPSICLQTFPSRNAWDV